MTSKLDPAFVADCPYGPEGLLLEEILEIDKAAGRVVAKMPVHADLPLTNTQRADPVKHPRHLSGGLMVHMTGMMGFLHAYYCLDLRHADGWVGYGAKIHEARFLALAEPGEPLILTALATRSRRLRDSYMTRYTFEFTQSGKDVYYGDQTAVWMKVGSEMPAFFNVGT